jgi:hypothetical protein
VEEPVRLAQRVLRLSSVRNCLRRLLEGVEAPIVEGEPNDAGAVVSDGLQVTDGRNEVLAQLPLVWGRSSEAPPRSGLLRLVRDLGEELASVRVDERQSLKPLELVCLLFQGRGRRRRGRRSCGGGGLGGCLLSRLVLLPHEFLRAKGGVLHVALEEFRFEFLDGLFRHLSS